MTVRQRRSSLLAVGLAAAAFGAAEPAPAAEAVRELLNLLTGEEERAWVETRWDNVLSVEEARCIQGETWVFAVDGAGTVRTCRSGTVVERPVVWTLIGTEDGLPVLELNGTRYVLDLRQRPAELEGEPPVLIAILRTLRTNQSQPIEEIWLEFRPR